MRLQNLFDSHLHLLETGLLANSLDLTTVNKIADFAQLERSPRAFRGPWLIGFGWDENKWPDRVWPTVHDLDPIFGDTPVYFSRADGHAGVTNSVGLKLLNRQGVGYFREREHFENLANLPKLSDEEIAGALRAGARRLNEAGFTHAREMGAFPEMWKQALCLERAGDWTIHLDWNFSCENLEDFRRLLPWVRATAGESTNLNRVLGMKIYFDGSLGSETAWLSEAYANRTDGSCGEPNWTDEDIETVLRETWTSGLELAVHTIGDAAADRIVDLARRVSASGIAGRLNLEHVEILRPETIQKMKPLHVVCHLQPCHWLSDHRWLEEKCGRLARFAFPWESLRRMRIPFHFGSDSPIEPISLARNLRALAESAREKIPALDADPLSSHVHPGPLIGESFFEGDRVVEVRLHDRVVYRAP